MIQNCLQDYIDFQTLRINAQAKLEILVAERSKVLARKEPNFDMELQVRIINQQTYISRIDEIIKKWSDALIMLASTYGDKELKMFSVLIIKNTPLEKVKKWSKSECLSFINRVNHQLQGLKEKGD